MKKGIIVLVLLFLSLTLISCDKGSLTDLVGDEILTQKEERYYIYFHRDNCEGCEKVLPTILSYIEIIGSDEKYASKRKMYGVNLSNETNAFLYRLYRGENGQGTENDNYINGVSNWKDLYIGHTPLLVSVTNGKAYFVAQGNVDIESSLKRQLGDYS